MADTSEIRKGAIIRHNNDLYVVNFCQFVNPGKGAAFTKTKMRSISSGKGTEMTFKSGENVDIVQVQHQNMQYLYNNGTFYSFMNKDSYETVEVNADVIGDDAKYLKEGLEVVMVMHEGNPVAMNLPIKIQYTVKDAPAAVRGDSSGGNVTKEMVMENGLVVYGPIFIKEGEEILVNSETGEYGGRVVEK